VPFHVLADLYVVNTCTVTSKAEQKARHDFGRRSPECLMRSSWRRAAMRRMEPAALTALGERVIVISGDLKAGLLSLARWLSDNWQGHGELFHTVLEWQAELRGDTSSLDRFAFHPERFAMHSRPALKVQDGCNNRCSFCRVCLARGPSVSLPAREALARVRRLEEGGRPRSCSRASTSRNTAATLRFSGLLSFLVEETIPSNQDSSYEPERVDDALLAAFANPRVRPHMHLSVQAGCTDTHRRMPAPTEPKRCAAPCRRCARSATTPSLRPTSSRASGGNRDRVREHLQPTVRTRFCVDSCVPLQPETRHARRGQRPHVPERVAGARVERLLALAGRGKAAYIGRWLGREVEMVVEHETADAPRIIGTTENYLKAEIIGNGNGDIPPGGAVRIVIQEESRSRHAEITAYRAATA